MAFLDGDEGAATRGGDVTAGFERRFDDCAISHELGELGSQPDRRIHGGGAAKLHMEVRRNGAGRLVGSLGLHQMIGRRPVAVAVEERADDAAIEHVLESVMVSFRLPSGDDFIAFDEALDVKTFVVGGSATKAYVLRRVAILQALHRSLFKSSRPRGLPWASGRCSRAHDDVGAANGAARARSRLRAPPTRPSPRSPR